MPTRPHVVPRRPLTDLPFLADLHAVCQLPENRVPTDWRWNVEAEDYCVVVAVDLQLIADLAHGATMHRVPLLRSRNFLAFDAGDCLTGQITLPAEVVRAVVRLRYVGQTPRFGVIHETP